MAGHLITNTSALLLQVITLAGELLDKAGALLKEGLTTTEIADGYAKASEKARSAALTARSGRALPSPCALLAPRQHARPCGSDVFGAVDRLRPSRAQGPRLRLESPPLQRAVAADGVRVARCHGH